MSAEHEKLDFSDINLRANVLQSLGWEVKKFRHAWIMVIGAGALGNEVLKNLALIGVGNILLVDFDVVEHSNLARSVLYRESDCTGDQLKVDVAARRLRDLNPDLNVVTINGDISIDVGWGVFRRMDVIIGCVDNRLARLYINRIAHRLGKTWIDGGIVDLGGQMNVFTPGISCYECSLSEKAWKIINFRMGCADRAMRYASSGQANTIPITASIIGAAQVQEALKVIADQEDLPPRANQQLYYEGLSYTYLNLPTSPLKDKCESHQRIEELTEAPELSHQSSIGETLNWLSATFDDPEIVIALDHTLVLELGTEKEGKRIPIIKPRPHLRSEDMVKYALDDEDSVRVTQSTAEIGFGFPQPELPLSAIGIPALHILKAYSNGEKKFIELSGDRSLLEAMHEPPSRS